MITELDKFGIKYGKFSSVIIAPSEAGETYESQRSK
jgi:hypothetical protein